MTASEIVATDANKKLSSLAVATYPSLTELSYVKGVTSAVQTQLGAKVATTGNETVAGIKTFSSSPIVPTPTTDMQASTKKYVDDNAGGAPEGTAVKSTGETGGTKFLREDGDGTCSWQTPAGSGDMLLGTAQTVTAAKTFNAGTLKVGEDVAVSATATEINVLDGIPATLTATELGYVDGVTSAIQTQLGGKVDKSTYDAHSILYATTDDTPAALTVGEQTVVGRATGGNISAIAIDSDLSSVSANDDTVPSAKATKAMGDLKLPLAGGTMTGDIQLGETDIKLDAALSGDETWSGIVIAGTAGATLAVGDVCYLKTADSQWYLVDGILDGTDTGCFLQLGICVLAANDNDATEMLVYGKVRSAAFPTFTVGAPVYLSDTAGDLVVAQPSTTNFVIRKVGYAISETDLLWNPSNDFIVHS